MSANSKAMMRRLDQKREDGRPASGNDPAEKRLPGRLSSCPSQRLRRVLRI